MLEEIQRLDEQLTAKYSTVLQVNADLDRTQVSFQANKSAVGYRWCKYKEGFSASLIDYIFDRVAMKKGPVLDPFAGSGTTLFVAAERGVNSVGIELLPHSAEIIRVRSALLHVDRAALAKRLREFAEERRWEQPGPEVAFAHLRITAGAFSPDTQCQLQRYRHEAKQLDDSLTCSVTRFAAMCVLEIVSYTRKDGQYLRWDHRSGRRVGKKKFDKGRIWDFSTAVSGKLREIANDLEHDEQLLFAPSQEVEAGTIELLQGSCLETLPTLQRQSFGGLITSPPYCNRYDYTRTYALELAFMGVDEDGLKRLRQTMLSCTVENRAKESLGQSTTSRRFNLAMRAWREQPVLRTIVEYLENCRSEGTLNNNGIPRMIDNYFREMSLVIFDAASLLKPGAPFVMVNDNVRYQGAHVPVDLILAEFAAAAGLDIETIWVLPRGKGNSSQQMGAHGRSEVRKCVYVWRKPARAKRAKKQDQIVALVR